MREARRVHYDGRGLWKRAVAGALALVMAVGLADFTLPKTSAAEATEYETEKAARTKEYANKFDLSKLLWNTNGKDANGNTVNYGTTARNYLYWAEGSFGGVAYKNYIHVFAFEGDTICFGSDVYNSQYNAAGTKNASADEKKEIQKRLGSDQATVDIVLTDLRGNRILYDVVQNGKGHIPNVQTEVLAKTMESPEGNNTEKLKAAFPELGVGNGLEEYTYTPLTYHVQETGVYTIEFHSYGHTSNVGNSRAGQTTKNDEFKASGYAANIDHNFYRPDNKNDSAEPDDNKHCALVAAWDVSVFNEQGHKETGRVYADYLSMQQSGSYNVVESYYVVTTDSYIYRWDWNGNTPNTYNFFADNKGLTDNATGSTLYKSVKELRNANFDYTRFGASFKYPGSANTDESKSYYIFFEMPNPDLEGRLYSRAIQPDPAENIRFVDTVTDEHGDTVPGSYVGMGGYFSFDTQEATTATLTLDFTKLKDEKGNPVADSENYAPVTISGPVKPYSTNYFYWDGKDGNGTVIPAGEYDIKDIITLTTKAGEIHFPVHDMEYAPGGFTFTRVSPIYNKDGEQISDLGEGKENILDATKNVIYYDDTAIYYGEKVGSTGLTEENVGDENGAVLRTTEKYASRKQNDKTGENGAYYQFNNMETDKGGEYLVRDACKDYVNGVMAIDNESQPFIRIGDHSHTTNLIQYYDTVTGAFLKDGEYNDQKEKIKYLNSAEYPVAKIATWNSNDGKNYGSTTDFGIVDLWTFVPAQPAKIMEEQQIIEIIGGTAFNLTGQVFYDKNSNGIYNSMSDSDTLLEGVTLNLYKKTTDTQPTEGKTYYTLGQEESEVNPSKDKDTLPRSVMRKCTDTDFSGKEVYELYRTAETPVSGRYFFTNIPYKDGEQFVYEVVRPGVSYVLTSGKTHPSIHHSIDGSKEDPSTENGSYALYAYDGSAYGTEVQVITVGNGGIKPNEHQNHTVTAVDVGYHYDLTNKFKLKKTWSADAGTTLPEPAVYEVCYVDKNGHSHVYAEEPVTRIQNLEHTYELLPAEMDGAPVKDWYVAAEYYFAKLANGNTYLFKHTFDYNTGTGDYDSFVGDSKYIAVTDADNNNVFDERDLTDRNKDDKTDWLDLAAIPDAEWETSGTGAVSAPFHAVLDRNIGSAETTITITNSDKPGVIEILKYTGSEEDHNYLSGATFRLYASTDGGGDITLAQIKDLVDQEKTADLAKLQVGSGSTRDNGRMTFSGLDPQKHYVIREVYPPAGYRAREVLYIVHPAACKTPEGPDTDHYKASQGEMTDDEWDTWQLQNLYFGEANQVTAPIANIPASGDMAIRKQIEGRAWGDGDSFTFDIAFRDATGKTIDTTDVNLTQNPGNTYYGITGSNAVRIPQEEYTRFNDDGGVSLKSALNAFLKGFDGNTNLTVNNTSTTAEDTISVHGMEDVKVSLPDTKQSVPLIVNGEIKYDEAGNPTLEQEPKDALMNTSSATEGALGSQMATAHTFPAAGTYTFTISENPGTQSTTDYTSRVYTVVVQVTRVLDPGHETDGTTTLENSYLYAEVQAMYYQDVQEGTASTGYPENYSDRVYYADVAPTFTNRYHIQPAVQTTSYAVQVDFSGRLDNNGKPINNGDITENWLASDMFTVTITGDDETTQKALEEGNIRIGGLLGDPERLHAEKKIQFNQTNVTNGDSGEETDKVENAKEHLFKFEELDFKDIEFPVKWVFTEDVTIGEHSYKIGDEVPPENREAGENLVVTYTEETKPEGLEAGSYFIEEGEYEEKPTENIEKFHKVESHTEDLVYHLTIKMEPKGKNGITYDANTYSMTITLKNSFSGDNENTAGIIGEMDLVVDKKGADGTVTESNYATCETDQRVVTTFGDWINPEKSFETIEGSATAKYTQYFIGSDGVIREAHKEGNKYLCTV